MTYFLLVASSRKNNFNKHYVHSQLFDIGIHVHFYDIKFKGNCETQELSSTYLRALQTLPATHRKRAEDFRAWLTS